MTKLWIHSPNILWDIERCFDFIPCEDYDRNTNVNAIARFCIYAIICILIIGTNDKQQYMLILFLIIVLATYYCLEEEKKERQEPRNGTSFGIPKRSKYNSVEPSDETSDEPSDETSDETSDEPSEETFDEPSVEQSRKRKENVGSSIKTKDDFDYFNSGIWEKSNEGTELKYGFDDHIPGSFITDDSITSSNSIYNKQLYRNVNSKFNDRQNDTSDTRMDFDPNKQKDFANWLFNKNADTLKEKGVNNNWTFNQI